MHGLEKKKLVSVTFGAHVCVPNFCLEHRPLASHFTLTMHWRICVFLLSVKLLPVFNL